ncbi:unnamed protein product [Phytomonas sp. Hart1]|nr:unnamed protein product [Phytomonas sp. Hart1]|eukprot:CCW66579.1 unnamed protein product [Phytomonas sp. isolate Hart1]
MHGLGSWESAVETVKEGKKKKGGGFQTFGLAKPLLEAILKQGFTVPTPIQRKAIPPMLQGNDVVAMARTGSGKTAAFLIPMLHLLKEHSKVVGFRGLVLSPTRELSLQIMRHGFALNQSMNLTFAALVGGASLEQQFELLAGNPDIVIATPGRLLHIMEESSIQLTMVRAIVLDEADRLFELGLQPQIVSILHKVPDSAQRALFSATMPSILAEFTSAGLHNPVVIRLDAEMKLSDKLQESAFFVRQDEKVAALIVLLKRLIRIAEPGGEGPQALIFVESKFHVEFIGLVLAHYAISHSAIHGQMDQEARRLAVRDFAKRQTAVMVVTDVAARGLDLPLLDNVINFSFPSTPKLFVHRVGRVARAGRAGAAYSILTFEDFPYYIDLMQFLDKPLRCTQPAGDSLFDPADGTYGRFPEEEIQLERDFLRRLHHSDVELHNLAKVVENAHQKYTRTRRKPTHDAIQAARRPEYGFDRTPLHPIWLSSLDRRRVAADQARFDLKRFKSSESLLELISGEKLFRLERPTTVQSLYASHDAKDNTEGKEKEEGSASANLSFADRMLRRAQERKNRANAAQDHPDAAHPSEASSSFEVIVQAPLSAARESLESGKYRDAEFFINPTRRETVDDVHCSVHNAVLDLNAETTAEEAHQRMVYAWNKKKNRYVQMHVNDAKALLKGVKNEAGKAINYKTKLQSYSKWMKKSKMRIQDAGEEEDLGPLKRARSAAGEASHTDLAGDENEENDVDMSDPNQGKKLRIGRKQKRLPKDGHVRTFEEMATIKRKLAKEKSRISRKTKVKKGK